MKKSVVGQLGQTFPRSFLANFHIWRNPFGLDKGLWLVLLNEAEYLEVTVAWFRARHCLTFIYGDSN